MPVLRINEGKPPGRTAISDPDSSVVAVPSTEDPFAHESAARFVFEGEAVRVNPLVHKGHSDRVDLP